MKSASPFQRANWLSVCVLALAMLFGPEPFAQAAYITTQPQSTNVLAGSNATFTVVADGTAPLRYRWQFNGTNLPNSGRISGATNATLIISNVVPADAGGYRVVVSNSVSVVTSLLAQIPPVIRWLGATNQTIPYARLSLILPTLTGSLPLHFQWRLDDAPLSGETNRWLLFSSAKPEQSGEYSVVIANDAGSFTSSVVTLTVLPPVAQTLKRRLALLTTEVENEQYRTESEYENIFL
jgi:hypothetical protein